jgi:NitT/TauT family transport system substrate-binding protein
MSTDGKPVDMSLGMDQSGLGMPAMDMGAMGMPALGTKTSESAPGGTSMPSDSPGNPQVAQFVRYSGWPELKEAFIAGQVKAAMLLAPMAMDLADKGIPARIVALGHRSGAVVMVRTESPYRTFADLKGKRIAIPSRFAVDHIFVRRLMKENGLQPDDVTLVEIAPPDMPAALLADAVDAYATGEPYGAKSEMDGYARILYMTRNVWPTYICCVLTVHEDLIKSDRRLIQRLVDHVMSAGHWLDNSPSHRTAAARIASDQSFFNQAFELLQWVMERPSDRVTYGDLRLIKDEFDQLMQLSLEAGIMNHPIPYETYVDESFMRNFHVVNIDLEKDAR